MDKEMTDAKLETLADLNKEMTDVTPRRLANVSKEMAEKLKWTTRWRT